MNLEDRDAVQVLTFLAHLQDVLTKFGVSVTNLLGGRPTSTNVRCFKLSNGLLVEVVAWIEFDTKKVLDWNIYVAQLTDGWRIERNANWSIDDWHESLPDVEMKSFDEVREKLPTLAAELFNRAPDILIRLGLLQGP